jgi:uncharacterized protein
MPALIPPFTHETAIAKVRMAEDAWNSRDPQRVSLGYTEDSRWRSRAEFINGRAEIVAFLTRKWDKELDYRLIKELWTFGDNRIAVRFAYEWHDDSGNWFRSYGNKNWEFDAAGVMQRRFASINVCRSASLTGSTIGPSGDGRTIIRAFPNLVFDPSSWDVGTGGGQILRHDFKPVDANLPKIERVICKTTLLSRYREVPKFGRANRRDRA